MSSTINNPNDPRGKAVFTVTTTTFVLASVFVFARLISRFAVLKSRTWDDWFIILAWASSEMETIDALANTLHSSLRLDYPFQLILAPQKAWVDMIPTFQVIGLIRFGGANMPSRSYTIRH